MGEIIQIQLGQCGTRIGNKYWDLIRKDHQLDERGRLDNDNQRSDDNLGVVFKEEKEGQFVPRSIFVDLEPASIDSIRSGPLGHFYRPDNYMHGNTGAGNNWAIGHYCEGAELMDPLLDVLRREIERTDCLQGFQLVHSLGGGTGSGLGTALLEKLHEEYPDRIRWTYAVCERMATDCVVRPYNHVLSLRLLTEHAHSAVLIENDKLFEKCYEAAEGLEGLEGRMNVVIAQLMSDVTSTVRHCRESGCGLRKLATNLAPFPRSPYLIAGTCPIAPLLRHAAAKDAPVTLTLEQLTSQLFDLPNMLIKNNSGTMTGKHLTAHCFFRGNIPSAEIDAQMTRMIGRQSGQCVAWVPDNIKTSLCDVPLTRVNMSSSYLANSTCVLDVLHTLNTQFRALFTRRAFLTHYLGQGMCDFEFQEALDTLMDVIDTYQTYQDATGEDTLNTDDEVE